MLTQHEFEQRLRAIHLQRGESLRRRRTAAAERRALRIGFAVLFGLGLAGLIAAVSLLEPGTPERAGRQSATWGLVRERSLTDGGGGTSRARSHFPQRRERWDPRDDPRDRLAHQLTPEQRRRGF